jgi:RsiW-degrading membrane proteinase PrsW (M82 family)
MWTSRRGTKYTIRGKVVASPKFGPWWVLWVHGSSKHQKCLNYVVTNLLFGLCISMWVIKCLLISLVPSRSSNTPLYPQSATSQGACPDSLLFDCFHFKLVIESIKELGSTSYAFVWRSILRTWWTLFLLIPRNLPIFWSLLAHETSLFKTSEKRIG